MISSHGLPYKTFSYVHTSIVATYNNQIKLDM